VLSDMAVQIMAIKKTEKSNKFIVIIYEPAGKKRSIFWNVDVIKIHLINIERDNYEETGSY